MNAINEIARDSVKRNRKNNISLKVSIFIAVIILSVIVIEITSINQNNFDYMRDYYGDYVASLMNIKYSELKEIKYHKQVKKIGISTQTIYKNEVYKRPEINLVKYDNTMSKIKNRSLINGKYPAKIDEIIVPSQLLLENKNITIGDNITIGERVYTITGVFNSRLRSFDRVYPVYGYLGKEEINQFNNYNAYIWISNIKQTYKIIPEILKIIGRDAKIMQNQGTLKYNSSYLSLKNVFQNGRIPRDRAVALVQEGVILILLIILFVMIISNAYTVWNYRDLKEIGLLKSVGMTKRQVRKLLKYKILYIGSVPILCGIGTAYFLVFLTNLIVERIQIYNEVEMATSFFRVRFIPSVTLFLIIISFLMVSFAAIKPAKYSNRISVINAIKNNFANKKMVLRNTKYGENILKSLAKDNYITYRRNYRAMTISLVVSCIIFSAILISKSYSNLMGDLNHYESPYNIEVSTVTEIDIDKSMIDDIRKLNGVESAIMYSSRVLYYSQDQRNSIFTEEYIDAILKNGVKNSYKGQLYLYGIQDEKFNELLENKSLDYRKYYTNGNPRAIIVDKAPKNTNRPYKRWEYMHFIKEDVDSLYVQEHPNADNKSFNIDFKILDRIDEVPYGIAPIDNSKITLIMPLSEYSKYYDNLYYYKGGNIAKVHRLKIKVSEIEKIKADIDDILSSKIAKTDFKIVSKNEIIAKNKLYNLSSIILITCFMIFILIIGFSNAVTSVNLTMQSRKRDFAILRSIGLEKTRMSKMLHYEGRYLIRKFIGLTFLFIILFAMGYSILLKRMFSTIEILLNMNWLLVITYCIVIITGLFLSYHSGTNKMLDVSIIEQMADE